MRVAVIGAGVAGLSAARTLRDRGHHVSVLDDGRVAGGRVATRHMRGIEMPRALAGATLAFDHGAQYFTVRSHQFSETVAEWLRDRVAAKWMGRIVAFDDEGWEDVEAGTDRYVGIPDMSAVGAALSSGLDLTCERRIESIAPLLDTFDQVVLAIPAPQALPLVAYLPQIAEKLSAVVMRPSWTVMAAFEDRVAARFDAAFVNGSPLGWIARNTSKPKRDWKVDAWVLHATTAWSTAHAGDRAEDVGAFLMDAFHDLIPAGLPRAFYAGVHRWRYATADPPLAISAIHDAAARITLCGDWCLGSRIEDAFLSGLAAADQITK